MYPLSHLPQFVKRRELLWLGLGVATSAAFSRCQAWGQNQVNTSNWPNPKGQALRGRAQEKGLFYGAASGYRILTSDSAFAARLSQECNILVPENDLKWSALRPSPKDFDFSRGDWLVNYAKSQNMQIRGHTLVWHNSLPNWFKETVNRQNAESYLIQHIETVAKHFAGQMHSWDVVNEAIRLDHGISGGWRKTPWLEFLGSHYFDLAFRVAAAADPNALLVYNDFGLEQAKLGSRRKRDAVLNLLSQMKEKGTPIHALGLQAHLKTDEALDLDGLRLFLKEVAGLGLKIFVTEMDVLDRSFPADALTQDRRVAEMYYTFLSTVLEEPAVLGVLTWGLSDRYSWAQTKAPRPDGSPVRLLPLDVNFNRKLAWSGMAHSIDQTFVRRS